MRAHEFVTERKKRKRKRSNRSFSGYWYPGFGYYGSGYYGSGDGNGGGDGGGESVSETVIGPDDLVDVYIRGQHRGETVTRLVARAFPNKNIPLLIKKLENMYGVNPDAVVYGPSRYVNEAKPIAPLVVPTPAQDSVEKSAKAIDQIDRVLNLIDIKKSSIEQEIANIKDQIEALKYGPPPGSQTVNKDKGWVGRDKKGNPIAGGPIDENFADGKVKGKSRPGRVKRSGASCSGSVSELRARAKKYGGERGRMYHWCANMKSGRKK